MPLNLDSANESFEFDVIPDGTLVVLAAKLKPGNAGDGGLLTRSSNGNSEYAAFELTVVGGPYDKRKVFDNVLLAGTSEGHARAADISRAKLRAIYESAYAIDPKDDADVTRARRANAELGDFNGLQFIAVLGIEAGDKRPDGGSYKDKNIIKKVLRMGEVGWRRLDQNPTPPVAGGPTPSGGTVPALSIKKANWAS